MKNATAALIKSVFVLIGKVAAMILIAATLTYIVLEFYTFQQEREVRQLREAELLDSLKEAQAERVVLQQRIAELERTMWGEIWPKVEEHAAKERIVVVQTLRNRDQEILKRLTTLETRLLRHLSEAH